MSYHAHAFIDGAYLRRLAQDYDGPLADRHSLAGRIGDNDVVQGWGRHFVKERPTALTRVLYYDADLDEAEPGGIEPNDLEAYWNAIEMLPDTELRFGTVRGKGGKRPRRQKGVDTLLAVDMLVGAFTQIYQVAILVAGDEDFVPVVQEVRRRGIMVVIAAGAASLSSELRRSADRMVAIERQGQLALLPLRVDGRELRPWKPGR